MRLTSKDLNAPGKDSSTGYGLIQAKDMVDYLTTYGCDGAPTPFPTPFPTPTPTPTPTPPPTPVSAANVLGRQLFVVAFFMLFFLY
jgi:hypothetical protein